MEPAGRSFLPGDSEIPMDEKNLTATEVHELAGIASAARAQDRDDNLRALALKYAEHQAGELLDNAKRVYAWLNARRP